jgi:hypothetical protein
LKVHPNNDHYRKIESNWYRLNNYWTLSRNKHKSHFFWFFDKNYSYQRRHTQ